jgi:hypothetical protein
MIARTMIARLSTSFAFFVIAASAAWGADFSVLNSGTTNYVINGVNDPNLSLQREHTYTFEINAPGHPFWIKTAQVTGTGSAYNSGVTNNGVDSGTLTFVVPADAPNTLFYVCEFHIAMTGRIDVLDPSPITPATWSSIRELYQR